jgi:glutathione synthase/RimK-type ligase-like ATP-grasp enzyme
MGMTGGTIGIFAFWGPPNEQMPRERTRALLAEAAFQEVDLCFFTTADCDLSSGLVTATRWRRGAWERAVMDLPCLVSIIGIPMLPEHREVDEWLRGRTRVAGLRRRDKLTAESLIAASPWRRHVIPSVRLDTDRPEEQITGWLAGGGVVIKPNDGTLGRRIQFVIPEGDTCVVVRDDERWRETAGEAVARAMKAVRGRLRYRDYMLQRYIDSRNASGQAIALRVDIARLPEGGWGLIRMVGHVAASGWLVSNAARGGAKLATEHFFASRRVRPPEEIADEAVALAKGIADAINPADAATNYEYGIDLAIDPDDRLWFIEANPSPQTIWAEHDRAVLVIAYLKSLAGA